MVDVVSDTHGAELVEVEVGVGELEGVERPAHRRDTVVHAPLGLATLELLAQASTPVVRVDGQVVGMEHPRVVGPKAEHRADHATFVESTEGHPTFLDTCHQHVHRDTVIVAAPYEGLEGRQHGQFVGRAQHPDLDAHLTTSTDSVTAFRNPRSRVTPIPGPAGTGMIPSVVSSCCSTMSRA